MLSIIKGLEQNNNIILPYNLKDMAWKYGSMA